MKKLAFTFAIVISYLFANAQSDTINNVYADSMINKSPYIFEGKFLGMITYQGIDYTSFIYEITRVLRGGDKLSLGTVEINYPWKDYDKLENGIIIARIVQDDQIMYPFPQEGILFCTEFTGNIKNHPIETYCTKEYEFLTDINSYQPPTNTIQLSINSDDRNLSVKFKNKKDINKFLSKYPDIVVPKDTAIEKGNSKIDSPQQKNDNKKPDLNLEQNKTINQKPVGSEAPGKDNEKKQLYNESSELENAVFESLQKDLMGFHGNHHIIFKFGNPQQIDSAGSKYFMFDITVHGNDDSTFLNVAQIHFRYDTLTFGSNIVHSHNVTFIRGSAFSTSSYAPLTSTTNSDIDRNIVRCWLNRSSSNPVLNRTRITTEEMLFYRVKIKMLPCNEQNTGIEFDSLNTYQVLHFTLNANDSANAAQYKYKRNIFSSGINLILVR